MMIQTLRSFRIGPFAVFDFAISYIAVYFLAPLLSRLFSYVGISVTRAQWLWLTLPISILVHLLSGAKTPFTMMVLDPHLNSLGSIFAKLVIVGMLYMGIFRG